MLGETLAELLAKNPSGVRLVHENYERICSDLADRVAVYTKEHPEAIKPIAYETGYVFLHQLACLRKAVDDDKHGRPYYAPSVAVAIARLDEHKDRVNALLDGTGHIL
jgi:hypothetical protein